MNITELRLIMQEECAEIAAEVNDAAEAQGKTREQILAENPVTAGRLLAITRISARLSELMP